MPALVALLFAASVTALAAAGQNTPRPARAAEFVGDQTCLSCHREHASHLETAHHRTSSLPSRGSIAGEFTEGRNTFKTSNPDLQYLMEASKDGFYQTAVLGTPPDAATVSKRIDIVIGSGRKGQTYLTWDDGGLLYQLPVSYWTGPAKWLNSPGFEDGELNFGRPITPRCVECHASVFESVPDAKFPNRFDRSAVILGISCEKCHGPGKQHVALQVPGARKPQDQAIVNPARLPRGRQIDACALCHGGLGRQKAPAFAYVPGRPLRDYLELEAPGPSAPVDVHGNQVALLERSRCFQASTMTCTTCHDVHRPQRTAAAFSTSCLACHKPASCGLFPKLGAKIADNCVDCHMPNQTSNVIVSAGGGTTVQPSVRSHWIKVYPETAAPRPD